MPGAVDTHAHVFLREDASAPEAAYRPAYEARAQDWLAELDRHGLTHGVLVQVSFLGTDNARLLAALQASGGRLRGVVQAGADTPAATLRAWDAAGVRGVRWNLVHFDAARRPDPSRAEWRAFLRRIADLGWHLELHDRAPALAALLERLDDCPAAVVVDHFAGSPEGIDAVARFAERHAVYVKLSAPYRISGMTAEDAARRLRGTLGDERLLWGSDWPFTRHEHEAGFAAMRTALDAWVPDAAARRRILWDAPARLFGLREPF